MIDIGYAGAFLGGVLTLLSPCSAILLPAFFAYAFTSPTALVGRTMVFYAGLVTMLVPLGVAASSVGSLVTERRGELVVAMSLVVIALGALQVLGVSIGLPGRTSSSRRDPGSIVSVYLLGTVYGVAGVCSGPILGSVLAVAALGTDAAYGGVLLAVYALGMVVPVVVLALLWKRLELSRRSWLRPKPVRLGPVRTTSTGLVSGVLFIAIGIVLLTTAGTANLGGVLSIDQQYAAESSIARWSQHVSNVEAVLGALVFAILALGIGWVVRQRRPETSAAATEPERPLAVRALAGWTVRQWVVAAVTATGAAVVVAIPTDLIDTPLFSREVPPTWWSYPVLAVTALLAGLLVGSYVNPDGSGTGQSSSADSRETRWGGLGGILTFFAVGCPVCNKLVLLALGTSGALQYFEPIQPVLAAGSIVVLGWALRRRLQNTNACEVEVGTR